jgi:hypothetical protein
MPDVSRALEDLADIRDRLAKGEVYRGWRSVPVAGSGLVGIAAAAWQATAPRPLDPTRFILYWLGIGIVALVLGCAEIVWHYAVRANDIERQRARRVMAQFLPAPAAGALATLVILQRDVSAARLLPGLWALLFGVAIFAARPYLPRASGWVALFYWGVGLLLLWTTPGAGGLSPWSVGGTFGAGQLFAAGVLYVSLERPGMREQGYLRDSAVDAESAGEQDGGEQPGGPSRWHESGK